MKKQICIEVVGTGWKVVRGECHGRVFAAQWARGTLDRDILLDIAGRRAVWFPFNESTGRFMLSGRGVLTGVRAAKI